MACLCCGMLAHPRRFRSSYPIRYLGFTYVAAGRGRGRYNWFPVSDFPDRRGCLLDLRAQMRRCLTDLDRELGLLSLSSPSVPALEARVAPPLLSRELVAPALSRQVLPMMEV